MRSSAVRTPSHVSHHAAQKHTTSKPLLCPGAEKHCIFKRQQSAAEVLSHCGVTLCAMLRSTKIVATLGPASSDPAVLERMVRAGVDVVRLNFSHGTADDHRGRAELVREVSRSVGRTVAIMCDLQGPKIRVGKFKNGRITLEKGQAFILDAACPMGDQNRVGLD